MKISSNHFQFQFTQKISHFLHLSIVKVGNSLALSFQKMEQLGLCPGDMIILKGEKCRETISTVEFRLCPAIRMQMNRVV
jgi:hypothetical protein